MSIEKFLPEESFSGVKPLENRPTDREFYNSDKTRKFVFYEWRGEDNFRQLNIHLCIKIGHEWANAMGVMTRWSDKEEKLFGLELDAITDDFPMPWERFYYDHYTGGLKRKAGMWASSVERLPDDERKMAESLGFIHASKLPQFVDFEKTAKEFMLQAKRLDFSNPVLYPKELLQ